MAVPTFTEAKKIAADDLAAVIISGKNPDGTDFTMNVVEVDGEQISSDEAKKIGADDLLAIMVSGENPDGSIFSVKTQ